MPRRMKSASSSQRSKRKASVRKHGSLTPSPRSSRGEGGVRDAAPLGRRLIAGLQDALAHAPGELELPTYTVTVPDRVNVAKLRHRLGLSQAAFARSFGLDVTALHAWEQGRRRPDRAARVLLAVIAKEPQAVLRALAP